MAGSNCYECGAKLSAHEVDVLGEDTCRDCRNKPDGPKECGCGPDQVCCECDDRPPVDFE